MKKRVLSGDRNMCPTCGEYFNSTAAFDKHRTGDVSSRRCMSTDEMRSRGMDINSSGWWVTERMPADIVEARA